MGILEDKQKDQLKDIFSSLSGEVKILMFTQEFECEHCKLTREMVEEVAGLSEKISVTVYDFVKDADEVRKYGVDKIPAIALIGDRDYGIRFYGVPAGYEFTTLIEDIISVSQRDPGLSKEVLAELEKVDQPVHLEVLISPTCPVCPGAVRMAHRFAMASDNITADMIETSEFPHLVNKYDVQGVPHTVINEKDGFVGAASETEAINLILMSLGKKVPKEFLDTLKDQHEHEHEHEHHHHEKEPKKKKPAGKGGKGKKR